MAAVELGEYDTNNLVRSAGEIKKARDESSYLKRFIRREVTDNDSHSRVDSGRSSILVLHHDGRASFFWLMILTTAVYYNLWTAIVRQAFSHVQQGCPACWFCLDALADFLYLCDILVQCRTSFLQHGEEVTTSRRLLVHYLRSPKVLLDLLCLLPLDFLQFTTGTQPMIRFPRFLKVYRTCRFWSWAGSFWSCPTVFRVLEVLLQFVLLCHWCGCSLYIMYVAENSSSKWMNSIFNRPTSSTCYLISFRWAMRIISKKGWIYKMEELYHYAFNIALLLLGAAVLAYLTALSVSWYSFPRRIKFERARNATNLYMRERKVSARIQERVRRWYDYIWSRKCHDDEVGVIFRLLPERLKIELAIHVYMKTLSQVAIFQKCQPEFLQDLVLKMKTYVFTPGDLICRKGEIAKEMFIVVHGFVKIVREDGKILNILGAGDFFGEIGILNLNKGLNKRSTDVRALGYLELFALSGVDVVEAFQYHPEAEAVIREFGQRRLRDNSLVGHQEITLHHIQDDHRSEPSPGHEAGQTAGSSDQENKWSSAETVSKNRRTRRPPRRESSVHSSGSRTSSFLQPGLTRLTTAELVAEIDQIVWVADRHLSLLEEAAVFQSEQVRALTATQQAIVQLLLMKDGMGTWPQLKSMVTGL